MRMPVTAVFVFVSLVASGPARAQVGSVPDPTTPVPQRAAPTQPPRDPRQQAPRTGTGTLRGRVVDGQTGQPLVHARVRLSGLSGGPSNNQPPTVSTDPSGAFEFARLPAGRFSLWIYKGGYNQATYPELAQSLRSMGNPIVLTDGQTIDNINVRLYHGSAIAGRIVDSYGDPIENVNVQVVAAPGYGPARSYSSSMANDVGEFRVGRLQPGAYLVMATTGGGRPFADSESTTPAPTYYPGVLSPEQAQPVMVERGQTVTGIDFQVLDQPVTIVTGLVTDSTGAPAANGNVHATSLGEFVNSWNTGNQIRPDGSFELKLPPGTYRLDAFTTRRDPSKEATSGATSGVVRGVVNDDSSQMGFTKITIGGEPMSNVLITTGSGGTISGRFVFDGEGQQPDPGRLSVMASPRRSFRPGPQRGDECRAKPGKVNPADLTFTIEGVYGSCILNVNIGGGMGRWLPRSAIYREVDLLDRPVEITNQQHVRDVPVMLTTKRGEISAEVTDDQGSPTQDYVLLAFSTDKGRWSLYRYVATAVRSSGSVNPNQPASANLTAMVQLSATNGAIIAPGTGMSSAGDPTAISRARLGIINWIPPGEYYVVALDDIGVEDIRDPAYLEQLVGQATRATLREGESQALQLHRRKAPPSNNQRAPR